MKRIGGIFLLLMILSTPAYAAPGDDTDTTPAVTAEGHGTAAVDETHPVYCNDARWVGGMLVAVAGLFLAAMVVGPIVRAEAPEVVPAAMSHEEDPAADRIGHADAFDQSRS